VSKRAAAMDVIRVLQRLRSIGEPIAETTKLARIASDLARVDAAAGRAFMRRAEAKLPWIREELRKAVERGELSEAQERDILAALSKEIRAGRSVRRLETPAQRLARAKPSELAKPDAAEEIVEAVRSIVVDEIPEANVLTTLLTPADWHTLVRRAATLGPGAANTMTGLIHETITGRLPEYKKAVEEGLAIVESMGGKWRPLIPKKSMALDMDDATLRDYVDKGVYAVHPGPPPLAVPVMTWEDKNESNLRDLFGKDGQLAEGRHRLEGALLRLDGKDYFVPQPLSKVLRDNRFLAAPKAPSKKKMRHLIVELKIHARPVKSPIPSRVIRRIGRRMIELLAHLPR
jgi:hypothetical protein